MQYADQIPHRKSDLLHRLIVAHMGVLVPLLRFDESASWLDSRIASLDSYSKAAAEETQLRKQILSHKPRDSQEAIKKLTYLAAVVIAARAYLREDEMAELIDSVARFRA